jgi:hypothetical protein
VTHNTRKAKINTIMPTVQNNTANIASTQVTIKMPPMGACMSGKYHANNA